MAKNISKGDLRKEDFLVLRQSRDNTVTNVIAPNGLQVGLTDDRFREPLTIKGSTIGEGGLTGSLTQLVDGSPYLLAGANILLTTGSTGQITVATSIDDIAVRRNKQQYVVTSGPYSAGTDILLPSSGLNTIGVNDTDDFIDIYHNNVLLLSGSIAEVTAGTKDYYIKPADSEVVFGFSVQNNDTIVSSVISSGSSNVAAAGDGLTLTNNVYNVNVASAGGIQITSDELLVKLKSGGALAVDSDGIYIDIDGQTDLGVGVATGDFVLVYDSDAGLIKKVSVGNVQGAGATIDIAGVSNSLNETNLATGDLFAVADVSTSDEVKKITVQDFAQYLAAATNGGISESSGKLSIELSELASSTVDVSADSIAILDSTDSSTKLESISDLVSGIAGTVTDTGLSDSAGTLNVDITNQTAVGTISTSDEILIYDVDAAALKKATVNELQAGSAAPPAAQYVVLSTDATLSGERVLTPGDGLDLTDAGAGSTVTLDVDVTDIIDTSYGLTETSNNIQVALKSGAGLTFDSGEIKVDYGSTSGLAAQGSNQVNILAGDGLKTGGSFSIGATTSTVQLDIKPSDFAGNGLKVVNDDLVVSIGAGDNITIVTGSDGSFIISSSLDASGIYTAGDGLDLTGQEFSVDLKTSGGLKIDSTELAVEVDDFIGNGLQNDGSDNVAVKPNTVQGTGYAPVHVNTNGVSVRYDNTTIGDAGSGVLEVKDGGITSAKLQDNSVTIVAGDGLRNGGEVELGNSVTLNVSPGDFAGLGLSSDGFFNLNIDDSVVATLTGSVFSGHVGVTGSIHATSEISGSIIKASKLSGSLTTLENGNPYLLAGSGISLSTGSTGQITITGNVGDITEVTAGTGLTGGGDTGSVTLDIDDSIVATLSGSVFSGHVGVTGSIHSTAEISGSILKASKLSGSLTTLENGNPYLLAGTGISLATGSDGSVTITGNVGDITAVNVGTGLSGGGDTGDVTVGIDNSIVATLSGSVFSGHVGVTGSIHSTSEISGSIVKASSFSGSLTTLENGNPYLLAGAGISIATGSDGAVTITGNVGDITGVAAGTGLSGGGNTGDVSLEIDDSIVATLTSSVSFSNGISGSLTKLSDGSSFIIAGNNINITSASNGAITIESSFTDTVFTAGTGLNLDGTEFSIDDSVVATLSGSVFSGHVGVTGSIHSTAEISGSILKASKLSGSLTTLENGSPYLLAGSGISLATGSDGSVTITGNVGDITEVAAGVGLSGGGNAGSVTLNVDDSVVATLTSSVSFSNGISGSLTHLADGTSYIIAGNNITVSSASNGAITISSTDTNTEYTAGTGLNLNGTEFSIDDSVVATLSGSVFSGHVGATGSIHSTVELKAPKLSGSLTTLSNGNPYLKAGTDIILSTGSDGSVTITGDFTQNTPGSPVNSVQFNTAGDFDGDSDFVYDTVNNDLVLSGTMNLLTASLRTTDFENKIDLLAPSSISSDYSLTLPLSNGDSNHLLKTDGNGILSFDFADRVYVDVRNGSGGALSKGTPVHISGYNNSSDLPLVIEARAGDASRMPALGILAEDLPTANSLGKVCIAGYIEDLNTSAFSIGDILYVGSSGGLTSTKPTGVDDVVQLIATCINDTAAEGIILVKSVSNAVTPNSLDVVEIESDTITATTGFSGSLTHLADGSSYLIAGDNITITTGSNGSVTIASTGGSGGSASFENLTASTGLTGTLSNENASITLEIDNSVVATLTGSVFSGNVLFESGLSGSLQTLADGTAYLAGAGGISITTASNGQITISGSVDTFASPGTPDRSVQFNSSGVFTGDSDFVYDNSSNVLTLSGTVQQLTASVFSSGYSGSVNLVTQTDFDSDITFILPQSVGEKFQFLQTDGTGSLTFDYADRVRIQVRNNSGYNLLAGTPVYITGYNAGGDRAYIAASSASLDSTMPAAAVLAEDLDNNSNGHAALIGFLEGVDTDLFNIGDTLYVASDGGLTNSKPLNADDLIQNVGFVLKTANNGIMYVTSPGRTNDVPNDLVGRAGLSGSLQMLADGTTRYLVGTGSITVYTASNGQVVVSGSEGNVYTAGTGLSLSGYEFSVDDSLVATLTSSVNFSNGISGSLTNLSDGSSYLVAGANVTIVTQSNGSVIISAQDDNTLYSAGNGLNLDSGIFSIDDSIVATLSGSDFSGIVKAPAFSGSLTKLEDGSSYLIAGSNVTIVTGSNGAITISSIGGGGGSITATSGSTSIASMSTIRFGPGLIMNEDSTGIASITSSIGEAEDGDYTDGLFTDFTPQTHIGTAVDRFNEILAALSPSPAPALDDISEAVTDGITAFLSFGSSNDQTLESPAYPSVLDTAGIGDEVDVNESYSATVSGNNIRLGIYDGTQDIQGVLNEDVPSNSQGGGYVNYPANSFGDGDTGVLKLEVNGSVVKEIDLTVEAGAGSSGAGTADYVNGNGSGFLNISEATEGTFSNGNSFQTFKHRTGEYIVDTADQRNGWNYLRIQHVKTGSTITTNYVEWVNDANSDALSSAGNSLQFEGSGSIHLSGVEYFRSGSLTYNNRVSNAYKYIYDTTNITFSTSNSATYSSGQTFNFIAQTKPTIDTAGGEDHTKQLHLTSSSDIDASYFINGTVTVGTNVTHPLKSNISNGGQATASQILMYDLSNTSTNLVETFRRENFRIISGSYDSQSDVTNVSNEWNSEVYMTASNGGHSNGLQFFNQRLLSPTNTISSGDFTGFTNGPSQNPDYSGETGTRTFYRWFRNTTGADQFDFSLALQGSGTIVSHGTSLGTSTINALVKLPGKTGWMDVAETFVLDSVDDNDGASAVTTVISKDLTLNATNYINFGNVKIENNQYVLVCIKADESWTGHISNITVVVGSGTGTLTPVPDLDDIGCDQDGTDVNLSFGASKPITDYTSPSTTAGFTAADLNDLYQTAETSNNLRRAVFNGATTLEGQLNADVGSPGNDYVTYAFSDANTGSIKLEVNGTVIHEIEITGSSTLVGTGNPGSGTGTSLNSDGSGFISLSNWGPGLFDNGVPRYSEIQRTAKYRIVSSSQRDGWNYARVLHEGSWGTRTTNYIEWIVDANSEAMASTGNGLTIFGDNTHSYLSGVKYFNSPSGSILTRVSNIYKNVYSDSSSAISFTALSNATASRLVQSGSGLSSTKTTNSSTDSLQTLSTVSDSQNELLHVSGTINFTRSKSLPGTYTTAYSCAGALVFDHPFKSNLTIPTQTTTNLLVWSPSDTSNANTIEYFTGEDYRLVSGSYSAQSDVSGGSNDWDSTISMDDQATYPEHATGLLVYDTYLLAPKDGGASGDFRNHDEGGSIESPAGNVNYSSLTNSTRDYFRSFLNNTTNDRPSVQITISGDATIVGRTGANAGALGSNKNIFVDVCVPGKTGFLDLGKPSAGSGNYSEGDGCLSGDLDATVDGSGATNTCTFNGRTVDGTVSGAEYLVIRISASDAWTGYLDQITISWS